MAAAGDSDLERTEEPTARRLQQARDEGQVARSQDASAAAVVIGALGFMVFSGSWLVAQISALFASGFRLDFRALDTPSLLPGILANFALQAFLIIAPILAVTLLVSVAATALVGGGLQFSWNSVGPKFSKVNPLEGLKRIFGLNALVELLKAILKFSIVLGGLYLVLDSQMNDYLALGNMNFEPAMGRAGSLVGDAVLMVAMGLLLIALIDEMKDIEGRPEVKAQIRRRQREMAANRMMQKVKDADVVVTNPEHFAVALSYDPTGDGAPVVLAKGIDQLAFRIREEAERHGVQIFSAPPLARALYFTSDLDKPIHHDLYFAVAQVIAYVFSLQAPHPGQRAPNRPNPRVPDSMRFDVDGKPETVH
ncbi:MAG: flagellar biosynthesis protein FlhB [Betaproteobacteria bacterium]|nr:flagellar biosynthesis protein FlhB [Betaproteobacteria bacterium]